MVKLFRALALSLVLSCSVAATAAPFDPRALPVGGPRTQILVLGTPHLSQIKDFNPSHLAPLLDRLAAFKPDVITIEALSGPECDYLVAYKAIVPGVAKDYCRDTDAARKATGLDVLAATTAVEAALKSWPPEPTFAQRRHLAALFLASNDRFSAAVQWLRLPVNERRPGDGMDQPLVEIVTKVIQGKNENIAIAATLAARLGLERVHPVDNHTADTIIAPLGEDFGKAIQAIWNQPSTFRDRYQASEAAISSPATLIAHYRFLNSPANNLATIQSDMGAALQSATPPYWGRQYVAWWEARNLRMAANIRVAFGNKPGSKVLSIVGASHKAYFESYLGLMSEVTLVDSLGFLR